MFYTRVLILREKAWLLVQADLPQIKAVLEAEMNG